MARVLFCTQLESLCKIDQTYRALSSWRHWDINATLRSGSVTRHSFTYTPSRASVVRQSCAGSNVINANFQPILSTCDIAKLNTFWHREFVSLKSCVSGEMRGEESRGEEWDDGGGKNMVREGMRERGREREKEALWAVNHTNTYLNHGKYIIFCKQCNNSNLHVGTIL